MVIFFIATSVKKDGGSEKSERGYLHMAKTGKVRQINEQKKVKKQKRKKGKKGKRK